MNQGELIEVAAAIADGSPIDWERFALRAPLTDDFVLPARIVERIARVYTTLPPADAFRSSLHLSLAGRSLPGDAEAPPETPVTWGTLTVGERIGRGTFGDVYRAHDRRLNRTVALKLLRRKDRFESVVIEEGRLLARVHHPNVVAVHGAERIEGRVGLWMQLVDGTTLEDELKSRGPFPVAEIVDVGIQVARALAAVHAAGLLHRDIKAQNAMRDRDGRVLLTDFGTGLELAALQGSNGTHELVGTPLYIAPDVLDGVPASASSDVYGLGVLLYYLATSSFPVEGKSLGEVRDAHRHQRRVPLRTRRPDAPARFAAVIERATAADPQRRYATAAELEAALVAIARPAARRIAWLTGAALLLAAAIGAVAWPWGSRSAPAVGPIRDSVLVARFQNGTGDPALDGGFEFAVAQELRRSDRFEVVPASRVIDVLRLMKKPVDTIVDRTIGREVCIRDGSIKALVTGRIERTPTGYAITAELVDPTDGTVAASLTEVVSSRSALISAVAANGERWRTVFSEHLGKMKEPRPVQQVSTSSLTALELYNRAVGMYWSTGNPQAAQEVLSRAIVEDPDFAAAWMLNAFLLEDVEGPGEAAREPRVIDAAARGLALAEASPDWERDFLRGVYRHVIGDYAGSVPHFDAAVRLRPDFEPAVRFLTNTNLALGKPEAAIAGRKAVADQRPADVAANFAAASVILRLRDTTEEARPYISRLDELLAAEPAGVPQIQAVAQWRRMLGVYESWRSGDITAARASLDTEARELDQWPAGQRNGMRAMLGLFYITLGRLRDAERLLSECGDHLLLAMLAEMRDDVAGMRRHLLDASPHPHVVRLVRAGLLDHARNRLEGDRVDPVDRDLANIARAALAVPSTPEAAVPMLRDILARGSHFLAPYQEACEILATSLERLNRASEAIAELERCAAVTPRFAGHQFAGYWMKNLLRLAEAYRATGRHSDAERIERQLLRLLVFADADNPLVLRLDRRR